MASEITIKLIANITRTSAGLEYDEAVKTGTKYWDSVLTGRPDSAAKEAADHALSQLLGCRAEVSGRKHTWKEKILKGLTGGKNWPLAANCPPIRCSIRSIDFSATHLDRQIDSGNASDNTKYCDNVHQGDNAQ